MLPFQYHFHRYDRFYSIILTLRISETLQLYRFPRLRRFHYYRSQSICLFFNRYSDLELALLYRYMTMNQELLALLQLSYRTSSNEEIKAITEALATRSHSPQYVQDLLLIIGDLNVSENTTCAALAQLKNHVRNHWGSFKRYDQSSNTPDKQILLDNLLTLNISLADNYQYGKIIKDIITFLGESVLEHVPQLIELMRQGKEMRTCLNFLLGIIGYYQYAIEDPKPHFFEFLQIVIPILNRLIVEIQEDLAKTEQVAKNNPNPENIAHFQSESLRFDQSLYLSIKFIKKCLNWMMNRPQLRQYSFSWAVISLSRIDIYKEELLKKAEEEDNLNFPRGSEAFNYFHGRKWAIKYMIAFVQKILIYKQADPQISQTTTQFYQAHWANMTQALYNMFTHRAPKRIKLIEFELLHVIFKAKPSLMSEWFNFYMFQVLPSFIVFQEEDLRLAIEDPLQYQIYEREIQGDEDGNIRRRAAELWIKLIVDTEYYIKKNLMSEQFRLSINFIAECLKSNEGSQKIVGGYLLQKVCQKAKHSKIYQTLGNDIRLLCNWTICDFLKESNFLFLIKALEIGSDMASELKAQKSETCELLGQFILVVFTNSQAKNLKGYEILKIKACTALDCLHAEWFKNLSDQQIKILLDSLLEMTVAYQLEGIMSALRRFIYMTGYRIKGYAVEIINRIGYKLSTIAKESPLQLTQAKDRYYSLKKYSAISGYISTLTLLTFLLRERCSEISNALEGQLVFLLETYYSSNPYDQNQIVDYVEDILQFFHQYLSELKTIELELSPRLWFFYSVIVLKMFGLPPKYKDYLSKVSMTEVQLKIMLNCFQREQFYFNQYLKLLKVYQRFLTMDQHLNTIQHIFHNIFSSSPLEQLFLMALFFYQNKKESESEWEYVSKNAQGKLLATILMIYVLEEHGSKLPKEAFKYIWLIILKNERQTIVKKYIKRYNIQLFFMWLWTLGEDCFALMSQTPEEICRMNNFIIKISREVPDYLDSYDLLYEEVRRAVLGISTLLLLTPRFTQLRNHSGDLIQSLLQTVRKDLRFQGYDIQQSEGSLYSDEDQLATEVWMKANNFTDEFETKDETYSKEDEQNEVVHEPQYVVDFHPIQQRRTKQQELEVELEELVHPQSIYYEEYISRLDSIEEYEYSLQVLKFFKQKCPQEYLQMNQSLAQYALASILRAIDADQKKFQEYGIQNLFNLYWYGDELN